MIIYEYIPPKNYTRITGVITILIAFAVAFFITPALFPSIPVRWLFQLLGVFALVAVVYIIARYVAKTFAYGVIKNDNGSLDLTVTEILNGGKRKVTVCRVGIANITESYFLHLENSDEMLKIKEVISKAHCERRKCFDYCHDMKSSPVCILLLEECGEQLLIKISPDERLCDFLNIGGN